ncbi:hypothetical protein [Actinomadura nitritigenes]|uniref:hypothetical protein n=1 Tax=Actinomadura nitritigenes TaxID=134602 RepID=UPI003D8BB41A
MYRPEQQQKTMPSLTAVLAPPCAGTLARPVRTAPASRNGVDRAQRAPELYAWDIDGDDAHGQAGVTDDRDRAIGHVKDALAEACPGTSGKVRRVALSGSGRGCYVELGTEATAHLDAVTNAVVWTG